MADHSPRLSALIEAPSITISTCRFCAIDFESAGAARGSTDTPVQIGVAAGMVGRGLLDLDRFVSYLKSDKPIQWAAARVHGITTGDLADAPALAMLWPEINRRMRGAAVVAHGKGTEKRFLRAFPGHGFGPWIDTLLLSRAVWPDLPDHSLGSLCERLGISADVREAVPGKSWHDALFDAVASLVLLKHLIDLLDLYDSPLAILINPDTAVWHRTRKG